MASPSVLTFDAEGRAVDFEVWVDDLQLFLQCDRADGLSLFDLTSGASPAPAADADATVRSQWATRDAAARLAVRRHLPTTERAHFSQYKSAQTLARGARALEGLEEAVEVVVEVVERVGVVVGVVPGVAAAAAAVEAAKAVEVAKGAEAAEEVEEAEVEEAAEAAAAAEAADDGAGRDSAQKEWRRCAVGVLVPALTSSVLGTALAGVAILDLGFDAILAAMYAVDTSVEGACYLCVPPDPGIEAAALGAGEAAALGASASAAPGASASAAPGAGVSALSSNASAQAFHTFTLDSGASRSFFRDRTTLTPLSRPVAVSLADPSGGPVLASFSIVLPCPAAPSGTLSGLYLPSFSTNLVSGADLQDRGVDQFTPAC
ncbi:unnamed protein product [Closterium sp. NIES-65]|nr:unnamed protein product [Closterium sp. NIES-65]